MGKGTLRHRVVAAAGVTGVLVLSVAFGTGVAPAQPGAETTSPEALVKAMPDDLKTAVKRDLGMDATTYAVTAQAAKKASTNTDKLRKQLGEKFGGAWFDKDSKKLHVAVTDDAAASKVKELGGEAHPRPVSEADLLKGKNDVAKWAKGLPADKAKLFHSVAVNAKDGKLTVGLDTSDAATALQSELPKVGVEVTVKRTKAAEKELRAGDGYTARDSENASSYGICSVGFNGVDKDGKGLLVTAGHCFLSGISGKLVNEYTGDKSNPFGKLIGKAEKSKFDNLEAGGEGDDHATIRVTDPTAQLKAEVNQWQHHSALSILDLANPNQGDPLCKSGTTTGWQCGTVLEAAVNQRIGDNMLTVFHHDACSIPGDSGGAVLVGQNAVGVTSGGAPNKVCPGPGEERDSSYAELLVRDTLPDYAADGLTVLTANGDADGDGVKDIDELNSNPTQIKDANGNGVAAYRDADEPTLAGPKVDAPANDARLTERKPVFNGTAKPNAKIQVTYKDQTAEVTADAAGKWSFPSAGELAYGGHEVTFKQKVGETLSRETKVKFTVVPAAPAITEPKDGVKSDNARPKVSGTGTAKATVVVKAGDVKLGEATVGDDGKWSVTPGADLAAGKNVISATQAIDKVESDAVKVNYEYAKAGGGTGPTAAPSTTVAPPANGNNGGGPLAKTGVDYVLPMVIGGAVALAGGTALVIFFRRRKTAAIAAPSSEA